MGKGIFFAVDAAFAVVLALAILAGITLLSSGPRGGEVVGYSLSELAGDQLASMDKSSLLRATLGQTDAQAAAAINSFVASTMPGNAAAFVNVSIYQYVGLGACPPACNLAGPVNGFCQCRNFAVLTGSGQMAYAGSARRMFFGFNNNVPQYGVADFVAWLR